MDKKQICIKFSREICDILDIPVPFIKFVSADRMHTRHANSSTNTGCGTDPG